MSTHFEEVQETVLREICEQYLPTEDSDAASQEPEKIDPQGTKHDFHEN